MAKKQPVTRRRAGFSAMISHPGAGEVDRQIPLFAEAGFDTWFLACGVTAAFDRIPAWAKLSAAAGITLEAVHAPTDGVDAMWGPTLPEAYLSRAESLLDLCSEGGVDKLVLHVTAGGVMLPTEAGLSRFAALEDYASARGVHLCYENAGAAAPLVAVVENASAGHGFCYDAGHELCYTPSAGYLSRLGQKLLYTHLHDNHGGVAATPGTDEHLLPYDGARDWQALALTLAEIGYRGTLNAELACFYRPDYRDIPYPAFLALARARLSRLEAEIRAAETQHS